MALSFRQRLLLVLVALGVVPTAAAILGWALTLRSANPAAEMRSTLETAGASGRMLIETIDSTRLTAVERQALNRHARDLNAALSEVQRAEASNRYFYAGLTLVVLGIGTIVLFVSVRLGGHLTKQLSRPIDELVGWTVHIRRREPLPADQPRRGAPEFAALRHALREMATGLEDARRRELEAERLRAFREVARRVAHEMKNPLTPIRFAVAQLERAGHPEQREALDVLLAESGRLERLAREFTDFGRLPEGPAAEVDLGELLAELARTAVPPEVSVELRIDRGTPSVVGHYEPLRRAFGNLLRNAVEAMHGAGRLEVDVARDWSGVVVRLADHGPGVPAELREQIFQPYFTANKNEGTGLGLTLVRQTVEAHGGRIQVTDTPGGGATFVVNLPCRSAS